MLAGHTAFSDKGPYLMPNYRRRRVEAGTYFFTLVTHGRIQILTVPSARRVLREAMLTVRDARPFEQLAAVLLADHLHVLWRLPEGDSDYSTRLGSIKQALTRSYLAAGGQEGSVTSVRRKQEYRGVWQKRFYEHTIRDYGDFKRHLDYIHVNPVKHGLVTTPRDYPWSSFHRYVQKGEYEPDWCGHVDVPGGVDIEPEGW